VPEAFLLRRRRLSRRQPTELKSRLSKAYWEIYAAIIDHCCGISMARKRNMSERPRGFGFTSLTDSSFCIHSADLEHF
jgi:hypothetical protein